MANQNGDQHYDIGRLFPIPWCCTRLCSSLFVPRPVRVMLMDVDWSRLERFGVDTLLDISLMLVSSSDSESL